MAVVQGIREKVHLPIYDCFTVKPGEQLSEVPEASNTNVLKFFVNVQGKTKLQTNLQAASLLPHYNTFEARAMRVVISDLPPVGSEKVDVEVDADQVTEGANGAVNRAPATFKTNLKRAMELLNEAREAKDNVTTVTAAIPAGGSHYEEADAEGELELSPRALEDAIRGIGDVRKCPPDQQIHPNNGAGNIISNFIYNTVTSLYVGEKLMIQMPTWFFPAGAGPFSEAAHFTTHGQPDPMATFRFAEPVFIDKQQNFRVEVEFPDAEVHREIKRIYGPFFMWVVLDGFMIRDVQ